MSPGGHLVTTLAACGATAVVTESLPLTVGLAAGGFLIDVDHALDYVFVERQRDLRPAAFLRYYLEGQVQRAVLVLHSYELFAVLAALAWWWETPVLAGYLLGGLMHLALDIAFNGKLTPYSIWAFYSFTYRARYRFSAAGLLGSVDMRRTGRPFWSAFFRGGEARPETTLNTKQRIGQRSTPNSQPGISAPTRSSFS